MPAWEDRRETEDRGGTNWLAEGGEAPTGLGMDLVPGMAIGSGMKLPVVAAAAVAAAAAAAEQAVVAAERDEGVYDAVEGILEMAAFHQVTASAAGDCRSRCDTGSRQDCAAAIADVAEAEVGWDGAAAGGQAALWRVSDRDHGLPRRSY